MANIQITDLAQVENVVELNAEEQSLIQGGIWPFIILAALLLYPSKAY